MHGVYEEQTDGCLKPIYDHYVDQVGGMRLSYNLLLNPQPPPPPMEELENIYKGWCMIVYVHEGGN